ncbi:MAG: hypothetical protein JNM81_10320 [Rhodospirillaceae bacterium]|nr:hypothetical protein [Rhodospirillaceae bacterium]
MIFVVFGWVIVVCGAVALITRPWKTPEARAPLQMGFAAALGLWVIWTGGQNYADFTDEGLWTGATLALIYVPFKAILYALLGYFGARAALNAWTNIPDDDDVARDGATRWRTTIILATIIVFFVGSDIFTVREATRQRNARDQELTPDRIAKLERRVILNIASPEEKYRFLENPLCPATLLEDMAVSPDLRIRIAVARNPSLSAELATQMAADPDGEVRYLIAHHKALPLSQLQRLASDPYDRVREAVAWKAALPDAEFNRLVDDPSPSVRATIVLQRRLSDDALRRLTNDTDERVRTEAMRIAAERGLQISEAQ